MTEIREFMNKLVESDRFIGTYEERVRHIGDRVIAASPGSKEEVKDAIRVFSTTDRISDYTVGGTARREFVRDVMAHIKDGISLKRKGRVASGSAKERRNELLLTLAQQIEAQAGNCFPDGDPIDFLLPWCHNNGIPEGKAMDYMDKAAKLLGAKSYHDYLSMLWDSYAADNPENEMGVTADTNPWK